VGQYRCDAQNLDVCNTGRTGFLTVQACASAQLCDATNAQCDVCVAGAFSCQGADLHQCAPDGQSDPVVATCATAALCPPSGPACTPPVCNPGDYRCNPNSPQDLEVCNSDQNGYAFVQTCSGATPVCDAVAQACVPGA
jgi:hypothetical protein